MAESNGEMTVYIAKNGGFDEIDEQMRKQLQCWMRLVAEEGRRRDVKNDLLGKGLLKYYSKRLMYYWRLVRESLQNHRERLHQANPDPFFAERLFGLTNSPITGKLAEGTMSGMNLFALLVNYNTSVHSGPGSRDSSERRIWRMSIE